MYRWQATFAHLRPVHSSRGLHRLSSALSTSKPPFSTTCVATELSVFVSKHFAYAWSHTRPHFLPLPSLRLKRLTFRPDTQLGHHLGKSPMIPPLSASFGIRGPVEQKLVACAVLPLQVRPASEALPLNKVGEQEQGSPRRIPTMPFPAQ